MIWLLEFFIGMVLYYLIISPRLRGFLKRSIQSWSGRPVSEPPKPSQWVDVTFRDMPQVKTTHVDVQITPKSRVLKDKREIQVKEEDVEKWLRDNPDLRKAMAERAK